MNTDFFDLCGQIYADFSTPLSPSCEEGSLSHSQALALSIRARDVAGGAIALPEFWSASGACAFVLKSSFNSLYDPFGSPCRGQKPSLPLKKAPPLISVFSPQGRRGKPPYSVLEPLRYKVGGPSKVSPGYAGWDRQGRKSNMREFYCCFANDDQVIFISILIPPSRH